MPTGGGSGQQHQGRLAQQQRPLHQREQRQHQPQHQRQRQPQTNVNVNVEGNNNCCNNGWDDDYHPVATAAAITATVAVTSAVIGSMVRTVPANCVPVNYGGMVYQQCGSTWYQPQGSQFIVVNPPY